MRISFSLGIWLLFYLALAQGVRGQEGREVFVAPSGDDSNPGSFERPFRTISRAAQLLRPGDTCTLRGGVYREQVEGVRSGRSGSPILFRNWPGEKVIVNGCEPVSTWKQHGQRWTAPWTAVPEQVFVDQTAQSVARWPNASLDPFQPNWAQAQAGSQAGRVYHPALPAFSLAGAWIKVLPGEQWVATTRPVESNSSGVVVFESKPFLDKAYDYSIKVGTPFYLAGSSALLDVPGEWWWDRQSSRLHLMLNPGENPQTRSVEVKTRRFGFNLRKNEFVELRGLRFFACSVDMFEARGCKLEDCHFLYPSHFEQVNAYATGGDSGVLIGGSQNLMQRCSVHWSAGNGVTLIGEKNSILDCLIRKVAYSGAECAAIHASGREHLIEHCTLSESGRSCFTHPKLARSALRFCDLSHAGLLTRDTGLTYSWNDDGEGTEIAYNWAHDNQTVLGCGLYIDMGRNFRIHHNVCWSNKHAGIALNSPCQNTLVCFNTLLFNGRAITCWAPREQYELRGTVVASNILGGPWDERRGLVSVGNFEGRDPRLVAATQELLGQYGGWILDSQGQPISRERLNFQPGQDSPVRRRGVSIEGIEPSPNPDPGAYPYGKEHWVPGHTWGELPP